MRVAVGADGKRYSSGYSLALPSEWTRTAAPSRCAAVRSARIPSTRTTRDRVSPKDAKNFECRG